MKHNKLKKHKAVRPTTSKAREALFNILRGRIEDARFLDLYAGTGAVGIDALRAGASESVFVEISRSSAKHIQEAVEKHEFHDKSTVVSKKTLSYLESAELDDQQFDIIFLDPPYHTDEILHALSAIGNANLLKKDGIVIAEHFKKIQLADRYHDLIKTKEYNYGDTVLTFFKYDNFQEH